MRTDDTIRDEISRIINELINLPNIEFSPSCPFYPQRLRVLWEITHRCNLNCIHCFVKKDYAHKLTKKDIIRLLENLKRAKVGELWISGGEPLLVKDLPFVVEYATSLGLIVSLSSSLSLPLSEEEIKRIYYSGVRFVHTSLDGLGEVHNRIRGKDIFHTLDRNLDLISRTGIIIGISTVLSKHNMNMDFKKYFNYIKTKGIKRVSIYKAERLGAVYEQNFSISLQEELHILKRLLDTLSGLDLSDVEIEIIRFSYNGALQSCKAEKFFSLLPNGELLLCPWLSKNLPIRVGNILYDDPVGLFKRAITYTRKILDIFKENRNRSCNNCQFKNSCGGGCVALAFHTDFKLDPVCLRRSH